MAIIIRSVSIDDRLVFIDLVQQMYSSTAVLKPIPNEYITNMFDELMRSNIYLEGYVFVYDNNIVGYGLLNKTYSNEAGGLVIWIEEIFVKEEYRSLGIGKKFIREIKNRLGKDATRIRLEVEHDNQKAIDLYKRLGFHHLPYMQMYQDVRLKGN